MYKPGDRRGRFVSLQKVAPAEEHAAAICTDDYQYEEARPRPPVRQPPAAFWAAHAGATEDDGPTPATMCSRACRIAPPNSAVDKRSYEQHEVNGAIESGAMRPPNHRFAKPHHHQEERGERHEKNGGSRRRDEGRPRVGGVDERCAVRPGLRRPTRTSFAGRPVQRQDDPEHFVAAACSPTAEYGPRQLRLHGWDDQTRLGNTIDDERAPFFRNSRIDAPSPQLVECANGLVGRPEREVNAKIGGGSSRALHSAYRNVPNDTVAILRPRFYEGATRHAAS